MFFDSFETATGIWRQACISFPHVGQGANFSEALTGVLRARDAVPNLNLAMRLGLSASGDLRRTLILLAPEGSEGELRRFVASFSRLELTSPGSVQFAQDCAAVDQLLLGTFPAWHSRTVPTGFAHGKVWFAAEFRVAAAIDQLMLEAQTLGLDFAYQMQACRFADRTRLVRAARHNLLDLEALEGIPAEVLRLQQHLIDRLSEASYLVEEIVGVEPPPGQSWLVPALERLFATKHAPLGFGGSGFEKGDYSEILQAGFPRVW